ncbi:hypothetical protein J6590_008110 [Homalodisca vitripennis]|nr:hypothetical protein J6590_008110 [Homalodisca vitripennis]
MIELNGNGRNVRQIHRRTALLPFDSELNKGTYVQNIKTLGSLKHGIIKEENYYTHRNTDGQQGDIQKIRRTLGVARRSIAWCPYQPLRGKLFYSTCDKSRETKIKNQPFTSKPETPTKFQADADSYEVPTLVSI